MRTAILVLGARLTRGEVGPLLARRLGVSLEVARAHPECPVVVSGRGEGPRMAHWLTQHGLDPERVVVEAYARSTNENLERAHALMPEVQHWFVVSSRFHLWRVRAWARLLGLSVDVVGAPTPVRQLPKHLLREVGALIHSSARIIWRKVCEKVF